MEVNKEKELYQFIIDSSWNIYIFNYLEFIYNKAQSLEKDSKQRMLLIDNVLKRILENIKNTINIEKYDLILEKIRCGSNDFGYDLAFKIIKEFYNNELNQEYSTIDTILELIQQYRDNKNEPLLRKANEVLQRIFSIHYIYYVKK